MGFEWNRRATGVAGGVTLPVQSLTQATTSTDITNKGVTFIVSGSTAGGNVFSLAPPRVKGATKTIVVDVNTTDAVDVVTAAAEGSSAAGFFFGTTGQALRFSTGAVAPKRAMLVGQSTSTWAVTYLSTGVTIIGTTV